MQEVVEDPRLNLFIKIVLSFLLSIAWFILSFLSDSFVRGLFYGVTASPYAFLTVFSLIQFFVGIFIGFIGEKYCAVHFMLIAAWMAVWVILDHVLLRSYIIIEFDFVTAMYFVGNVFAGFVGFFCGGYLMRKKWG